MLLIALIAFDIGSARVVLNAGSQFLFLLSIVSLPMVNILAIGMLLASLRPRSRFIMGFEAFGALGLALFVIAAFRAEGLVPLYLSPAISLDIAANGPPPSVEQTWLSYRLVAGFCLLSLWATWPQLAFAIMGGFFARKSGATGRADRTPL